MDEFKTKMKQWVELDNQISMLSSQIDVLNDSLDATTDCILDYVEANNMDANTFRLSDGGSIAFKQKKRYPSISYRTIETAIRNNNIDPHPIVAAIKDLNSRNVTTELQIVRTLRGDYSDGPSDV
jgi:hypothetical protein